MPVLGFRETTAGDFQFAWDLYAERVRPLRGGWAHDEEKAKFVGQWNARDNKYMIELDGNNIGWFSCAISDTQLTVDNLHFLAGARGVPSIVLNVLALCGREHGQKVFLQLLKKDPIVDFFKTENFPMVENADDQVTVDASFQLRHWHQAGEKQADLPWNRKNGASAT